jgi:hypothetical protein
MSWETYRLKLREMTEAAELARFNCELAESFTADAVEYTTLCVDLIEDAALKLNKA